MGYGTGMDAMEKRKIQAKSVHCTNKIRFNFQDPCIVSKGKGKGKSVPLQAWSGQEGSRKLTH
jgi:hypothetical protein